MSFSIYIWETNMPKNVELKVVTKEDLHKVLIQYPNHVEFFEKTDDGASIKIYRLKEMRRIIGMELIEKGNGTVCKLSEAFFNKNET